MNLPMNLPMINYNAIQFYLLILLRLTLQHSLAKTCRDTPFGCSQNVEGGGEKPPTFTF